MQDFLVKAWIALSLDPSTPWTLESFTSVPVTHKTQWRFNMAKKRYTVKTGCPQCGCSGVQALSEEEMRERYGDVPNFDMECSECMAKFTADMKTACPEWDKDCKLEE